MADNFFEGENLGKAPKGTRWGINDKVPKAWMWAAAEKIERDTTYKRINLKVAAYDFETYWPNVQGAKGRKIDWKRTFINRCLELARRAGHREREGALSGEGYYQDDDDYGIGYRCR